MTDEATIPRERIYCPESLLLCESAVYLQTKGLPSRLEWRYPARSRFAEHHLVDFGELNAPTKMYDTLIACKSPTWYLLGDDWSEYFAIGTWTKKSRTGLSMSWKVCVDIRKGVIMRVESDPVQIAQSMTSQEQLASFIGDASTSKLVSLAKAECIVLLNSSPRQMVECFGEYFAFVTSTAISAEAFLDAVCGIDAPASESGSMWYLLVADYLHQGEY